MAAVVTLAAVKKDLCWGLILVALFSAQPETTAAPEEVVLLIRAANPAETEKQVEIRCDLPLGVGPEDIPTLSGSGLELSFDEGRHAYSIFGQWSLPARGDKTTRLPMAKRVWFVAASELESLHDQVRGIGQRLKPVLHQAGKSSFLVLPWLFSKSGLGQYTGPTNDLSQIDCILSEIQQRQSFSSNGIPARELNSLVSDRRTLVQLRAGLQQLDRLVRQYENNPSSTLDTWQRSAIEAAIAPLVEIRLIPGSP